MISVILAGGKGLRLWPESRRHRPKQLCKFVNDRSMLDHTIDRLNATGSQKIIVITNDYLKPQIEKLAKERPDSDLIEVLSEPEGKNTAPAVGLVLSKYHVNYPHEIIGVFPADHHVLNTAKFKESIRRAYLAAQRNHLITIGITPDRPETGFGYIEKTKWEIGEIPEVYHVNSFYEKPDLETAQSYLKTGEHMWNSGIYIGKTQILMEEFQKHLPAIYEQIIKGHAAYINSYSELPNISLDYGIAEKSERMAVVPADFGWCDLGSWNALNDLCPPDECMNVCTGNDVMLIESNNCIVKQKDKTIVVFGADNLLVIETDDIIFVSDRNKCQDIRHIVKVLEEKNRHDLL